MSSIRERVLRLIHVTANFDCIPVVVVFGVIFGQVREFIASEVNTGTYKLWIWLHLLFVAGEAFALKELFYVGDVAGSKEPVVIRFVKYHHLCLHLWRVRYDRPPTTNVLKCLTVKDLFDQFCILCLTSVGSSIVPIAKLFCLTPKNKGSKYLVEGFS